MGWKASNKIGRWKLNRMLESAPRNPVALNISEIQSSVLVFQFKTASDFEQILKISDYLKIDQGLTVDLVGCCFEKNIPDSVLQNKVQIITKDKLDFWGIPKDEFSGPILKRKYDLMMNFCTESFLCTDFFLGMIDSKVNAGGSHCAREEQMDLLIETPVKSGKLELSKNIVRYLEMINKR